MHIINLLSSAVLAAAANVTSASLSAAPAPKRLGFNEQPRPLPRDDQNIVDRAFAFARQSVANPQKFAWTHGTKELMEEFGLNEIRARNYISVAFDVTDFNSRGSGGGRAGSVTRVAAFHDVETGAVMARAKLADLRNAMNKYNDGVKSWSPENVLAKRKAIWKGHYDIALSLNGGDVEDATLQADKSLKFYIERENFRSGPLDGLGWLTSALSFDGDLITENADGTLTLNNVRILTLGGKTVSEIFGDLGNNVDKAA